MKKSILLALFFLKVIVCLAQSPVTRVKPFRLEAAGAEGQLIIADSNLDGQWNPDLVYDGSVLLINGDTVATLPVVTIPLVDTFSFDGTFVYLSFEGDNKPADTLNLSSLAGGGGGGTDNQNLTYNGGGSLSIETGNTVDMSDLLDNTDSQTLSLGANTLSITGGNSVDLSAYLDNTDNQLLGYSGNGIITLEDGGFIDITDMYQQFDQFELAGNILVASLSNDGVAASTVNLSGYLDNTDDQVADVFSFNSGTNELSLSLEDDGQATLVVDLSSLDDSGSAVVDGNGIYSGNGTTPASLVNVTNTAGVQFQDVNDTTNTITIYTDETSPQSFNGLSLVEYIEFGGAAASLGEMYIGKTNGFVDLIGTNDQLVVDGATVTVRSGTVGSSFFLSETSANFTMNTTVTDFYLEDVRTGVNKTSIRLRGYGEASQVDATGADYSTLLFNSLVPKLYVDDLVQSVNDTSTWIRDTLPNGNVLFSANGNQYRTTGLDIWSVTGLLNDYFFLGKGQIDQSSNIWTAQIGGGALLKLDWSLANGHIEVRDGIDYFTFEDFRTGGNNTGIRYRGFGEANFLTDSTGADYSPLRFNSLVPKQWVVDYVAANGGGGGGFSSTWLRDTLPIGEVNIPNPNTLSFTTSASGGQVDSTLLIKILNSADDNFFIPFGIETSTFVGGLQDYFYFQVFDGALTIKTEGNGLKYDPAELRVFQNQSLVDKEYVDSLYNADQQCIDNYLSWELVPIGSTVTVTAPEDGFLVAPEQDNICIDKLRAKIITGTSATVEVLVNGISQGSVVATTSISSTELDVALNQGDHVSFNVSATSGAPTGLFATVTTKCDCS